MKSVTATKGIIVAGQYGVGKTETLRSLIRTAALEKSNFDIGAFVAESANVALDAGRYGIGSAATGVSFASVCCPTVADMMQALDTAMKNKSHDLLFMEPPGNMHPPLMAQVAMSKGIKLEHVVMLVSQRDFKDDRHTATFHTGLQVASVIGITHKPPNAPLNSDMLDTIRKANSKAPVISFGKGELSYSELEKQAKWDIGGLVNVQGFSPASHSDHYLDVMRVFNPELDPTTISSILAEIAKTGLVARAKGLIPKYNLQFDMKGTALEIKESGLPLDKNGMGYAVFFAKGKLPMELIEQVSIAPDHKTRQMLEGAPKESRFAVFGRLYKESQLKLDNIIANGKITYTYSPIDDAEKVATEIYKDTNDDSALRMALPLFHGVRLNALNALKKQPKTDDATNAFSGVHIATVLINTSLRDDPASPAKYPKLADQHQILEIKSKAIPALLHYAAHLRTEDIKDFPRFESAVGPYILKAAQIGWENLENKHFDIRAKLAQKRAKENMVKIQRQAGFNLLADQWDQWT